VIEVVAEKRTGSQNFVTCMRHALADKYGTSPVSIGGTFLVEKGTAWCHVMPDFPSEPLKTESELFKWMHYYNMDAPLVCLSVFNSYDPGWSLRMEHTHCFNGHGQGGHYHHDTDPEHVRYRGYFVVAEKLVRIDRPE
jgi:hypothetical protein